MLLTCPYASHHSWTTIMMPSYSKVLNIIPFSIFSQVMELKCSIRLFVTCVGRCLFIIFGVSSGIQLWGKSSLCSQSQIDTISLTMLPQVCDLVSLYYCVSMHLLNCHVVVFVLQPFNYYSMLMFKKSVNCFGVFY